MTLRTFRGRLYQEDMLPGGFLKPPILDWNDPQEVKEVLAAKDAEIERLREWQASVTVALQQPGGAHFDDVARHIRELVKQLAEVRQIVESWRDDDEMDPMGFFQMLLESLGMAKTPSEAAE